MSNALAQVGQCCPNETCELYGEADAAQVIRFGSALRLEVNDGNRRWLQCSPATAADFTDPFWPVEEI